MGHGKPPYAAEYRQQMVELVRAGRRPRDLAREFECSATTIRGWVRQADLDEGLREDGLTTVEREELRRLRPRGLGQETPVVDFNFRQGDERIQVKLLATRRLWIELPGNTRREVAEPVDRALAGKQESGQLDRV